MTMHTCNADTNLARRLRLRCALGVFLAPYNGHITSQVVQHVGTRQVFRLLKNVARHNALMWPRLKILRCRVARSRIFDMFWLKIKAEALLSTSNLNCMHFCHG